MKRRVLGIILGVVIGVSSYAQHAWNGTGGDDSWGTAGNWTPSSVPATNYASSKITFSITDLGNINVLETNRVITGTAGNTSHGLHYNINASDQSAAHTTDLNGFTLLLDGGTLQVGHNASNSVVVITNGTLQLGGATKTDVWIGRLTTSSPSYTGAVLTVHGTLNVSNVGYLVVGKNDYGNGRSAQGELYLQNTTIMNGGISNRLYLANWLSVGTSDGNGAGPGIIGILKLPASLTDVNVQDIRVGQGRDAFGELDFGSGSSLTNLIARRHFYLASDSGRAQILNLPTNIAISVGSVGSPGTLQIGHYQYGPAASRRTIVGNLAVTGGLFRAYFSTVVVGQHLGGNDGTVTSTLDLRDTTLVCDGVTNMWRANVLVVGSKGYPIGGAGSQWVLGTLKIPEAVTNITVGHLALGTRNNCRGRLDIGSNSLLRTVLITNGLHMSNGAIGYEDNGGFVAWLPNGIDFTVGQPDNHVQMDIGRRAANQWPSYSETYSEPESRIVITSGSFAGYISTLRVGVKETSAKTITGVLDIASATVSAFKISDSAYIGYETSDNQNGKGYVYLPDCPAGITNGLYIGDTHASSYGYLELNGTLLPVGQQVAIDVTGVVTTHVNGTCAGIDLASNDTNDFTIATGGRIHIAFDADPADTNAVYWGVRMAGDHLGYFQGLTNDSRLTWDTNGLSASIASSIGLQCNGLYTYVGRSPTLEPPTIENRLATNVTTTSANFNGFLMSTGTHVVTMSVYWGDADGGAPTSGNWQATNTFAEGEWDQSSYPTTNLNLSTSNKFYYYRFYATNLAGHAWAAASTYFLAGDIVVQAPDSAASEIGPDPGTFTVHRASGATNEDTIVYYTTAGVATNDVDYTLSPAAGSITILAGATSAAVTLTPIENAYAEPSEDALLVLTPGLYGIGSPSSNTITIADAGLSTNTTATDAGPWTGVGPNDFWSTPANWASNSAPALSYTGKIEFVVDDIGNINVLQTNRTINGPASSASYGLHYQINAPDTTQGHTTDLGGYTLTLNGGRLLVGDNASNSVVVITNGTLAIAGPNRTDMYVGINPNNVASGIDITGAVLTVHGTINATNLGAVTIGRNSAGNARSAQGKVDLSDATINCGSISNKLHIHGNLWLAHNSGSSSGPGTYGILNLPSSLEMLEIDGDFSAGYNRSISGTLDFGANSALTNLTVHGNYWTSVSGSRGEILNLPTNLHMSVGTVASPKSMRLCYAQYATTPYTSLALTNGSFTAYLSELRVAWQVGGNTPNASAFMDVSTATTQIGDEPNKIKVSTLAIGSRGGEGNASSVGELRIPSSITDIEVDNFYLGYQRGADGKLDIGANSSLQSIIARTGYYLGGGYGKIGHDDGGGFVEYLPAGITMTIGQPGLPAALHISRRRAHQTRGGSGEATLAITNGTFTGYISELQVGTQLQDPTGTRPTTGVLDLASATVTALSIGNAYVGAWPQNNYSTGGDCLNKDGKGYVYLPAVTTIVNNIYIGDQHATSYGLLEMFGTTLVVSNWLDIEVTGVITSHIGAVSAGILMRSSSTNLLTIATGGSIEVVFESSPEDSAYALHGIRMPGNHTNYFSDLKAAGKLDWSSTSGMAPRFVSHIAIVYDIVEDLTYIGVPGVAPGTVFFFR